MNLIAAFTTRGELYPAFISIQRYTNKQVGILVRTEGQSQPSEIILQPDEWDKLKQEIQANADTSTTSN